jgi:hypothetical protein
MPKTSTPIATEAKGFKFGQAGEGEPNSIQKIAKLDAFLVAYKDGEGKEQVRVAFRLAGGEATFIINEKIGGSNIVTSAHPWFHKAFVGKLESLGMENSKGESAESI